MSATSRYVCLLLLWPGGLLAQAVPSWAPWIQAPAMARLDASVVSVERSSFCSQNCRYDRYGRGAESAGANPVPARLLYRLPGDDVVLYDDPGAGVVSRLWLTIPDAQVACLDAGLRAKLYFGDVTSPQIDLPLAALFDGSTPPFTAPLTAAAASASGGYVSYVPIAYAHGLRIVISGLDAAGPCSGYVAPRLWYQIDAQHVPSGAVTADFNATDTFALLRAFLAADGGDPWQRGLPAQAQSVTLAPATSVTLAQTSGSGWLAGLRLRVPTDAWPHMDLDIHIDGASAMSMPLSRVFAADPGDPLPPRSPLMGVDADGWLYLWWPMAYRQHISVALVAHGLARSRSVQATLLWDDSAVGSAAGHFHARHKAQCGTGHQHQLTVLDAREQGKLVAVAGRYAAQFGPNANYLEGDTRMRLDASVAPGWQGSGLEDFYNGGFYFSHGTYRQPWSGASAVDVQGESALWRLLLGDAPHYANHLSLLQEAGASPDEPVSLCADTVTYRYAGARALLPAARLQVGATNAAAGFNYHHPAAACAPLTAAFADAGATTRTATVCRYDAGSSHFEFHLPQSSAVLRLRRTVDAGVAGQAARIVINGVTAGYFPPVRRDDVRRWQTQDAPLAPTSAVDLNIDIEPLWGSHGDSGLFTESVYELWAAPGDKIFADGFDPERSTDHAGRFKERE